MIKTEGYYYLNLLTFVNYHVFIKEKSGNLYVIKLITDAKLSLGRK